MSKVPRLWEIDCARGIAILMMIIFHTVFDLAFFKIADINVTSGFWRWFAYSTASLFLLIVGISLVISHARAMQQALTGFSLAKKFLVRGAGIFLLGLLVTVATYLYLGEGYVIFGILHLIGVSVMLSPLFFRFGRANILIGVAVILAGFCLSGLTGPAYLIPFGLFPAGFSSVDYTPLLPWLGVVLIGMGAGELLYHGGTRQFAIRDPPEYLVLPLSFLGRHSLVIYLVHQPVIILLIGLIAGVPVL